MSRESFTETDPAKVKPCLFCGGIGVYMRTDQPLGWQHINCFRCEATVEFQGQPKQGRESFEHGIEGWNRSMCFYRSPREEKER